MKQLEGWLGRRLGDATAHDIERLKSKLRDMTSGPQYARLGRMFYKAADREDLRKLLVMKQRMRRLKPSDIRRSENIRGNYRACRYRPGHARHGEPRESAVRVHE